MLFRSEHNIGAFSVDPIVRVKGYEVLTEGTLEMIHATMLDKFQFTNVRLIKIDVEGHELQVLQGAEHTLRENNYPPIIFESWTWKFPEKRQAVYDHLESLGYEITQIGQNNLAQQKK